MKQAIDWTTINAYVDGELSSVEAAAVANAIADDEELAQQVAVLTSLKAAIAESTPRFGKLQEKQRPKPKLRYIAAAAVIFTTITALLVLGPNPLAPLSGHMSDIDLAFEAHQQWRTSLNESGESGQQGLLRTTLAQTRLDAYIPDLTSVDLRFSGVRQIESKRGSGVHVGYIGPSGCTVTMALFTSPAKHHTPLTSTEINAQAVYQWSVGGSDFYLLATGMDPARLSRTAQVVYRLTLQRLPLDDDALTTLKQARAASQPCVG